MKMKFSKPKRLDLVGINLCVETIKVQELVISITDHGRIDGRPCKSIIGHTLKPSLRPVGRLLCVSCNWSGQSSSKRTREHRHHIREANAIFKEL